MDLVEKFKKARIEKGLKQMDWVTCLSEDKKKKWFNYKNTATIRTQFNNVGGFCIFNHWSVSFGLRAKTSTFYTFFPLIKKGASLVILVALIKRITRLGLMASLLKEIRCGSLESLSFITKRILLQYRTYFLKFISEYLYQEEIKVATALVAGVYHNINTKAVVEFGPKKSWVRSKCLLYSVGKSHSNLSGRYATESPIRYSEARDAYDEKELLSEAEAKHNRKYYNYSPVQEQNEIKAHLVTEKSLEGKKNQVV
ncbi:hypothetical protein BD770DRAFT_413048 [Pilaira anomala]|nr:hypothetical protein BD770DRAFT_413048 [Pilaira anomala]